jgi:hypothetical protein
MTGRQAGRGAAGLALLLTVTGCVAPATPTPRPGSSLPPSTSPAPSALPSSPEPFALPGGFPVPRGAVALPLPSGAGLVGAWTVDLDPPSVYDFFVEALPRSGLALDGLYPGGGGAVIQFHAANGAGWEIRIGGDRPTRVELAPSGPPL